MIDAVMASAPKGLTELRCSRKTLAHWLAARSSRIAEIGVWRGDFSAWLFEGNPDLHLTGVDPWRAYGAYIDKKNDQARLDEAYEVAQQVFHGRGALLRTTSQEAAKQIPDGSLDAVYIDGNHARAFVETDYRLWAPKVKRGGIVSGHDYIEPKRSTKGFDVKAAVDAYLAAHQIEKWFVTVGDKYPSIFWVQP